MLGNEIIVYKNHNRPRGMPKMCFGCMPYDNGNLILTSHEKEEFESLYPDYSYLIKRLLGSQEFIRGEYRYCFWISDKELPNALKNPIIKERIEKTRAVRLKSSDKAGRELADRAHQFREFYEPLVETIIIPSVSSELREYIPIGIINTGGVDSVISNLAFAIYDAQLWMFGMLTSKIHMIWVKAVGGYLGTSIRYSSTLCYNTFPFPEISEEKKKEIEEAAEEVLCVRAEHSEKTLAEMYDPDKMPADLRAAHHTLDLIVESCYRKEPFTSDEERLKHLFKLYEKMTTKK